MKRRIALESLLIKVDLTYCCGLCGEELLALIYDNNGLSRKSVVYEHVFDNHNVSRRGPLISWTEPFWFGTTKGRVIR